MTANSFEGVSFFGDKLLLFVFFFTLCSIYYDDDSCVKVGYIIGLLYTNKAFFHDIRSSRFEYNIKE